MSDTETDWAAKIGQPAMASIAEMVAALECDYERLEELRDERADLVTTQEDVRTAIAANATAAEADDDAAAVLEQEFDAARNALDDWDEDNAEELKELEAAAGDCADQDDARQRIDEDPLSIEVRSDWTTFGEDLAADEYRILLTTGGPAVCIEGELRNGEPSSARLLVQDWFKPWTEYVPADHDTLLTYARCFCFDRG